MVTSYTKLSISLKKDDENDFDEFMELAKKDPKFLKKNSDNSTKFIGLSAVFTKFWKFYLKKQKEK